MLSWPGKHMFLLLFWLNLHLALGCVNRKPQGQAPPLPSTSAEAFKASEEAAAKLYNKDIPPVCDGSFRVATFDVNNFNGLDTTDGKAGENVLSAIRVIKPTVVVLQNMPFDGKVYGRQKFLQTLKREEGFYHMYEVAGKGISGTLVTILSKRPIGYRERVDLGGGQAASLISLDFADGRSFFGPTFTVHILGVQLNPNDSALREKQAKRIAQEFGEPSKEAPLLKHIRAVVLGNFNDLTTSQSVQTLKNRGLVEAFSVLKWPLPSYTAVTGKTSDLVLVSEGFQSEVLGAYVYHLSPADTSTHLPVILDLAIPKKPLPTLPESVGSRASQWINYAVISVLLAILLGLLIYLYRRRRREQALPTDPAEAELH